MNDKKIADRLFYIFCALQLCVWTILPSVFRPNLPLDTIEGLTWGQEWQLGYDKNPYVNAWLSQIIYNIFGIQDWPFYFVSQICVVLCFWGVWRLANKMLTPFQALVSVLMLEGVVYFSFTAPELNDNVIELALWSLLILAFYNGLKKQTVIAWVLSGFFAGLALMTKYFAAVLFVPMLWVLLFSKLKARSTKLYGYVGIALIVFLIIVIPHFYWLYQSHFITFQYALNRASSNDGFWMSHLGYASNFLLAQLVDFIFALVIYLGLCTARNFSNSMAVGDRGFIWMLGLGPLVLTLLLSMFFGWRLHDMWGTPLLSLWGLLWVSIWRPQISVKKMYTVFALAIAVMTFFALVYVFIYPSPRDVRASYPGRQTAAYATQLWRSHYHTRLQYVAGPRWEAGNIAYYSPDHPHVFIDWQRRYSPWIDMAKMRQAGALFVWDADDGWLPADAEQRFPSLEVLKPHRFKRLGRVGESVILFFAILPPQKDHKLHTSDIFLMKNKTES